MGAYLQNWIDCNNDPGLNQIIVFPSKQHLCCNFFFPFFFFPPLFTCTSKPGHSEQYKISSWFCPSLPLLLLPLSWCCFFVINSLAVAPESSIKTMGVVMTDSAEIVKHPYSSPIQKQRHRKCIRETKRHFWKSMDVSQLFWIFWSHCDHVYWLCYYPYTDLKMSSADCKITYRD